MATHVTEEALLNERDMEGADLTVTNAVWVATALLHKKYPERPAFELDEIVRVVNQLHLTEGNEDSVRQHIRQHSVANKKPQPNTVCMLFDVGGGLRRLFRSGDEVYPGRNENRTHPRWEDLPLTYRKLQVWYESEWKASYSSREDPLFALVGTWKDEPADDYVAHLRENWSSAQ
jgi:hypothetical protein